MELGDGRIDAFWSFKRPNSGPSGSARPGAGDHCRLGDALADRGGTSIQIAFGCLNEF